MSDVWEQYFTEPVPPVEGGVNWEAYSHDELYEMLRQDADVADVSTVATEWARHHAALATHAEVLREQSTALLDSWQGAGAEEAARRLETLAARVEKISELANAGALATQEAADALATARAQMPPPPGNPAAPLTDAGTAAPGPSTPWAPEAPSSSSVPSLESYMSSMESYLTSMQDSIQESTQEMASSFSSLSSSWSPSTTTPTTTTPTSTTPDMGTAFGAVGSGGFSFYAAADAQDQQKAQAVQAMRTYESSLTSSGQLLGEARGAVPAAAPLPGGTEPANATNPATAGGGVPWQQLVGGGPAGGGGTGVVTGGPGAVPHGVALGPGAQVGALPGMAGASPLSAAQLAESAAARAGMHGGMVPPVGARGASADDEEHKNQMPTLNHGLFAVEEPTISTVLGVTGEQP